MIRLGDGPLYPKDAGNTFIRNVGTFHHLTRRTVREDLNACKQLWGNSNPPEQYYEGESNENLKSAIKIRNTARLSYKLTTMILMV